MHPVIYQIKPLVSNIGTLFKIKDIINEPNNNKTNSDDIKKANNSPIFFV